MKGKFPYHKSNLDNVHPVTVQFRMIFTKYVKPLYLQWSWYSTDQYASVT